MLRRWWPTDRSRWVIAGSLAVFAALLIAVLAADRSPVGPDLAVTSGVHDWALSSGYAWWSAITHLGEFSYLAAAYLVLLVATLIRRKWAAAVFVALSAAYSTVTYPIKVAVHRPRPPFPRPDHLDGMESFPSGHSGAAAAFALVLFCVVAMSLPGIWRIIAAVVCLAIPILVGMSRLALGVHFLTDVLAGFALAVAWVLAVAWGVDAVRRRLATGERAASRVGLPGSGRHGQRPGR